MIDPTRISHERASRALDELEGRLAETVFVAWTGAPLAVMRDYVEQQATDAGADKRLADANTRMTERLEEIFDLTQDRRLRLQDALYGIERVVEAALHEGDPNA